MICGELVEPVPQPHKQKNTPSSRGCVFLFMWDKPGEKRGALMDRVARQG